MCGITGLVDLADRATDELRSVVQAMTNELHHRGPDGAGIWADAGICLGHRRLSIQDLSSAGAQPMPSASGRFVIVFNGEIYNHRQMRAELEQAGAAPAWRGHSDTETLLAGIEYWGLDDTLRRTAGMFAIALWDRQQRHLSLARDRIGEKPLYWGWAGRGFVFGSELKALRLHPGFPKDICRDALALYLQFAYVPAPYSIHPGIYKLEPGSILCIEGTAPLHRPAEILRPGGRHASLSIRRYWSLDEQITAGNQNPIGDAAEAISALDQTLGAAVQRQMISDVPLGAFLSGGIDSSLIVAVMQQQSTSKIRSFTIGFEDAAFDEAPYAAAVAAHLGTEHTELCVTEREARDVIPILPRMYDEPFADSSQIPTHLVCALARQNVTVALTGDAGDELFGGYNRYFWSTRIWHRVDWMPHPVRQLLGRGISAVPIAAWDGIGSIMPHRLQVARAGDKAHRLAERLRRIRNLDDLYRSLVTEWPDARIVYGATGSPSILLDDPLPDCLAEDPAARMMSQDIRSYLPDDILCKVDRAAMSVSLETRVPFLDPDVLALSARIPTSMKLRDGRGKWILRQLLDCHVPRALIERPKAGFGVPIGDWLRGPLRPWAEDLLSTDSLGRDGLIDPEPVQKAWQEHLAGKRDWTQRLWIVLMLVAWRNHWS